YEIDGPRHDDLIALAHDAAQRGWWEDYRDLPSPLADFIALESEATAAREWGSTVIPGLLQSESYARNVIGGWSDLATLPPQELERRLEVRMRRRELLDAPTPLELSAIIDEAVLHITDVDMATMILARIEETHDGQWKLSWTNAGHPPPLLISHDGLADYLTDGHGILLGTGSQKPRTDATAL
ncbi:Scr1 family TA system antitoxin-like transcriptional regulator, partial [Actinomadura viridis]|uniref:Scr1 family TA system antitoxin-like transcriptional regulator n=1 Tax=Actinomadura viridis TaxID=58110 RepID=UPI0031ECC468